MQRLHDLIFVLCVAMNGWSLAFNVWAFQPGATSAGGIALASGTLTGLVAVRILIKLRTRESQARVDEAQADIDMIKSMRERVLSGEDIPVIGPRVN